MQHAQFGLEKSLFGDGIAADAAVFRSSKHDQITAQFKLALGSPNSCVLVRGPAGVGKTTLTSAALRASSTRLALAWLNAAPANAAELLELVLAEFGVGTVGTTRVERLQLWRQFQGEMRATESRLFVVVERTEDFASEVLRALDSLTAPDAAGNLGANVVLLGHAGIDEHLAAPVLESLRQRLRLRTELAPFTEAELQDYLRHQVACAGGHYDHVFAPGAVAAVYRHCGGIARLANTLCATALELAASRQQKVLTGELVTTTAVSMLGLAESRPAIAAAVASSAPTASATPFVAARPAPAAEEPKAAAPLAPVASVAPAAPAAPVPPAAPVALAAPSAPLAPVAPIAFVPPAPTVAQAAIPAPAPKLTVAPIPAAAPILASVSPAATAPPRPAPIVEFEYDGGATDITDVAMADFPILTDAVELPPAPIQRAATSAPPVERPAAVEAAAPTPKPPPSKPAPARPTAPAAATLPATPPAAKPVLPPSRVETAYAAQRTPKPAAAPRAAPAPIRAPAAGSEDDDVLRQTQTMRAIAVAKSIDDISSSMAETLFGDAGIDLVTAALASAAEWPDSDAEPPVPAANPPPPAEKAAKPAEPVKPAEPFDDPFDLFGLGDDAPLELIDDSTLPPVGATRKTAAR